MPNVTEHYENLLAGHYSWLFGGLEAKVEENRKFFDAHGIKSGKNHVAVDLGCGSGFQSIPLARLGFRVFALDLSPTLLSELTANKGDLPIETIQDDLLLPFRSFLVTRCELVGQRAGHRLTLECPMLAGCGVVGGTGA